jgi:hypothetical protein
LLCFARKNASGSINKLDRILPARFDPNVWCGRALQEAFIDSVLRPCNGRIYCRGSRVAGHVVAVNEAEIELGFRATSARRAVRNRAKLVASIDQVSQGRFLFGVGGGWNQDEIDMGLAHHRLSLTAQLQ